MNSRDILFGPGDEIGLSTFYLRGVSREVTYRGTTLKRFWTGTLKDAMRFDIKDDAEDTIKRYLKDKIDALEILATK